MAGRPQASSTDEARRLATLEMLRAWHGQQWPSIETTSEGETEEGEVYVSRRDDQLEPFGVTTVPTGSSA